MTRLIEWRVTGPFGIAVTRGQLVSRRPQTPVERRRHPQRWRLCVHLRGIGAYYRVSELPDDLNAALTRLNQRARVVLFTHGERSGRTREGRSSQSMCCWVILCTDRTLITAYLAADWIRHSGSNRPLRLIRCRGHLPKDTMQRNESGSSLYTPEKRLKRSVFNNGNDDPYV